MSYMVMECHRAYAIVLDSEGRFLKVANLGYSVGQKTDFVIESGADENLDDTGAEAGKPGSGRKNRALTFALLVNALGAQWDIFIPLNILNALIVGVLGLPGAVLLLILQ